MDSVTRWGLPEGFVPVRYVVSDEVKDLVRSELQPDEPVLVSLANEGGNVTLIATPQRLLGIRSGAASAGVTGFSLKEFPWPGITKIVLQQATATVKFVVHFRSTDGRTVALGRRAALGKDASENYMPFDPTAGHEAFAAIHQLWEHKRHDGQADGSTDAFAAF